MLRTVKLLALVAMFFVALASSAQVTTSALSGVVTDEKIKGPIAVVNTPSGYVYNDIASEILPQANTEDGIIKVISDEKFLAAISIFSLILFLFCVIIIAILNGNSIKIRFFKFNMEIGSKKNDKE